MKKQRFSTEQIVSVLKQAEKHHGFCNRRLQYFAPYLAALLSDVVVHPSYHHD